MVDLPFQYQVLYMNALIDVYQHHHFYGWTYFYGYQEDPLEVFNARPLYSTPEAAMEAAKIHALRSSLERSRWKRG